jgi:hypothetical protein
LLLVAPIAACSGTAGDGDGGAALNEAAANAGGENGSATMNHAGGEAAEHGAGDAGSTREAKA